MSDPTRPGEVANQEEETGRNPSSGSSPIAITQQSPSHPPKNNTSSSTSPEDSESPEENEGASDDDTSYNQSSFESIGKSIDKGKGKAVEIYQPEERIDLVEEQKTPRRRVRWKGGPVLE